MSIPIHPFTCLQRSVFLLNSRPGLFTATLLPILLPRFKRLFFRSYKTNLQSSLGKIISSALEYSSHPPVSVCGTIIICLTLEIISRQPNSRNFLNPKAQSLSTSTLKQQAFTRHKSRLFDEDNHHLAYANNLCHSIETYYSTGIFTCFPSTTLFSLILGVD